MMKSRKQGIQEGDSSPYTPSRGGHLSERIKVIAMRMAVIFSLFTFHLSPFTSYGQVNPALLNYITSMDDNMYMLLFDPDLAVGDQTNRVSIATLDERYLGGDGIINTQTSPGSNSVYSYSTVPGAERVNVLFIPSTADTDALSQSETILYFGQDEDDVIGPEIRNSSSGIVQGNLIMSLNQNTRSYMQFYVTQGFNNLTDTQEILRLEHGTGGNTAHFYGAIAAAAQNMSIAFSSITFSSPLTKWVTSTVDGSDNQAILISGGGSNGTSRGAYVSVSGNEHATSAGDVGIGTGAVGDITMISATDIILNPAATSAGTVQTNSTHTSNIADPNDVLTKGYGDATYSSNSWTSYSPTVGDKTNMGTVTISNAYYNANQAFVTVKINGVATPSGSGLTQFTVTIPTGTVGAAVQDVIGHGFGADGLGGALVFETSGKAMIQFPSNTDNTGETFSVEFSYVNTSF